MEIDGISVYDKKVNTALRIPFNIYVFWCVFIYIFLYSMQLAMVRPLQVKEQLPWKEYNSRSLLLSCLVSA